MLKLLDRVLYLVPSHHHTVLKEPVHDLIDGRRVPRFEDRAVTRMVNGVAEPVMVERWNDREKKAEMVAVTERAAVERVTHEGSVHHLHLRVIGAIVGRVRTEADKLSPRHGQTVYDILLLAPNHAPKWVDGAGEEELVVREDEDDAGLDLERLVADAAAGVHQAVAGKHAALEGRIAALEAGLKALAEKPADKPAT